MLPTRLKHQRPVSSLCFGTVQLGMPYGIANKTGMPDAAQARQLIASAVAMGVTIFDTARSYGEAEARLGEAGPDAIIVTKLPPDVSEDAVDKHVRASLTHLKLERLPYLLLHRFQDMKKIWPRLLALKAQGLIERLGVSISTPQEALDASRNNDVECIQLPFNVLDGRWEAAGVPAALSKRPDILVLARSAFLQGLLIREPAAWPVLKPVEAENILRTLDAAVTTYQRKSRVDLCLAYARSQPWIDSVVVGMETMAQLKENIALFEAPPLSPEASAFIRKQFPNLPEALLNPALWPKKEEACTP